jgi:Flp pilus assembly protein TadG
MDPVRKLHHREAGQVLVLTAVALLSLLAIAGLATDVGLLWTQKREMQTAADAAALGGARELASSGDIVTAARTDAGRNSYTHGNANVVVTVNHPPLNGEFAGDDDAVEAIVSQPKPTYFLSVFGIASATVQARAVARTTGMRNCIFVMHPSAPGAMTMSGNGVLVANCGAMVNSNHADAMTVGGTACLAITATSITGGYRNNSNGCLLVPTPTTGVPPAPDPLAAVPPPAVGGCDHVGFKLTGAGLPVTINPGVYCDGITINGRTVLLTPGTYILKGGGLSVGGGGNIIGTGVTFYNTAGGGYGYKAISLSGGSTTTLTAPLTGPLAGMLFFQDRSIVSNDSNHISGGSLVPITGTFYFSTTPLVYIGGASASLLSTLIVARTLNLSGSATVDINFPLPPTLTGAVLAE